MYDATDFATDLAGAAAVILPWVGAAVAAGLALLLIFMGIRKGVAFFASTAELRAANASIADSRERMIASMMSFGASREEASDHVDSVVDDYNARITKEAGDRW